MQTQQLEDHAHTNTPAESGAALRLLETSDMCRDWFTTLFHLGTKFLTLINSAPDLQKHWTDTTQAALGASKSFII